MWSVADFAAHMGLSHRRAKHLLQTIDAKHGGSLLVRTRGTNRRFTFSRAQLRRLEPDLFTPVESIEFRLELIEEDFAKAKRAQKIVATQVGHATRDIARLRSSRQKGAK